MNSGAKLTIFFLLFVPIVAEASRRHSVSATPFPPCTMITGTPAVTFTRDEGRTLSPTAERLSGIGYTYGLAALDVPGALLSWHNSTLSLSSDHGCTWRPILIASEAPPFPPSITAARGGRAYIWSDNREFLLRYDARGVVALKPPGTIIGVGVDPNDGEHLRAGDASGVIWESRNGGDTWEERGRLRLSLGFLFYRFAFDPSDLDHIVAGTASDGAFVTRDGGTSWTRANGIASGSANVFNLVISPVDRNFVWAEGVNLAESDGGASSHGRHIYLSRDAGTSFVPVVDESPNITLINGPVMAAHPANANVLYFVFGTYFQGYGTDLFRFDAGSGALTVTHNDYNDINAIAFSKQSPHVMYLGLESEQRNAP